MLIKNWKKDLLTVPNLLSLFRLLLIPTYIIIYLNAKVDADYYIAAGILAVSCLTDAIDGKIARHFNCISTIGKVLDPLADKATQFSLIICLLIRYPVLLILVCMFVMKELFQLFAGLYSLKRGKMLVGALLAGKICTTILFVSLILLVLLGEPEYWVVVLITVIDCIAVLASFLAYIKVYTTPSAMFSNLNEEENEEK